jgi:hypothetical protein
VAKIQRVVSNFMVVKIYVKIRVGQVRHYFVRWTYRVITTSTNRKTQSGWSYFSTSAAIKWTRLSCRSLVANAVRLRLRALAYNLGNFMRALAEDG